MKTLLIFIIIYTSMIATSIWESKIEQDKPWDKGKTGWKIKIRNKTILTSYHFWLFFITFPLLLSLPWIISGFNKPLFGILVSAYFSGLMIEDFFWFVVNPKFRIKNFNSNTATWYPWVKIWKFEIPIYYLFGVLISLLSWFFIWG